MVRVLEFLVALAPVLSAWAAAAALVAVRTGRDDFAGSAQRAFVGATACAWLGLAGLLMPIGIAIQVVVDIPPVLVIVGGAAMIGCLGWLALRVGTTSEA